MAHVTVLKKEAVDTMNLSEGSIVVDCTLGSGGHAREILSRIGSTGTYIGLDADPSAISDNQSLFTEFDANIHLIESNFSSLTSVLDSLEIKQVDAILADLGWRMEQFDSSSGEPRGFSFAAEEPLAMTFGPSEKYSFTAADIVNEWDQEDVANVIYGYGEDKKARQIARALCERRKDKPFTTSLELADFIVEVVKQPSFKRKTHPATRTFQALRIAVNDEFSVLETLLKEAPQYLAVGGRLAIISFHSLEDRIVKHTFRDLTHDQHYTLVHKKPIIPTPEELQTNPRARSAKLRTIERIS